LNKLLLLLPLRFLRHAEGRQPSAVCVFPPAHNSWQQQQHR
jgi:hypothetical protein